jgi:hypothetical protein
VRNARAKRARNCADVIYGISCLLARFIHSVYAMLRRNVLFAVVDPEGRAIECVSRPDMALVLQTRPPSFESPFFGGSKQLSRLLSWVRQSGSTSSRDGQQARIQVSETSLRRRISLRKMIATAFISLSVAACASTPPPDPLLVNAANAPIRCTISEDCEVKWGRAFDWVRHHSVWQINVATNSLIQTEGPMNLASPGFAVRRTAVGKDQYQIVLEIVCADTFEAQTSCLSHVLEWKANFASVVSGGETLGTHEYSKSNGL